MTKSGLRARFKQHLQTLCASLLLATALPASGQTAIMATGSVPMSVPGTSLMATSALNTVPASLTAAAPNGGASANPNQTAEASASPSSSEDANNANDNLLHGKDNNHAQGDEFQRYVGNVVGSNLPIFGSHLFTGAPSAYAPVDNVPVTSDYVLGPGDELIIRTWGAIDVEARSVIDRNGQISLPKIGTIGLTGIRASEAEAYLRSKISRVYKNFELNVTLGQLRSIRIYVVGHAKKPGTYTLSSLSTLINALFTSGGPAPTGSMRHIQLKRAGQTVTEIDLYDFIVKGNTQRDVRLLPGDVIVIPPAGPRVAVAGSFNVPAIYELKNERSNIREILDLSGGLSVVTTTQLASLERIKQNQNTPRKVEQLPLDEAGMNKILQNGDILTLFPISPKFDNAITLKGHVASPMRYSWKKGMRIADLLVDNSALIPASYWDAQNKGQIKPRYSTNEVNWDYATVQRLDPIKLTTELIAFDLGKAILGDVKANIPLEPGDIVTVYAWNDALPETKNSVLFVGELLGGNKRFVWQEGMRINDVIPDSQWLIDYYDFWQNMKGKEKRLEVNWDYANITRLSNKDLSKNTLPFNLDMAVNQPKSIHNQALKPGDVVNLFTTEQLAVPVAKRKMYVLIEGEVATPGTYQVEPGETLRQLVSRVGGATPQAYLYASEFYRESTRKMQQQKLDNVLDRMEKSLLLGAASNVKSARSAEDIAAQNAQQAFTSQALARMRTVKASGRMVLELPPGKNSIALIPDIPLEDGDRMLIPTTPAMVNVVGEIYNENAFLYKSGKALDDYLQQAGGATPEGDLRAIYVLKADGSVMNRNRGWFSGWFNTSEIMPGDTIVVPILAEKKSWTKELKDWTQILYQFGMGVAGLKVLSDL